MVVDSGGERGGGYDGTTTATKRDVDDGNGDGDADGGRLRKLRRPRQLTNERGRGRRKAAKLNQRKINKLRK